MGEQRKRSACDDGQGSCYQASKLILCAGAWLPGLVQNWGHRRASSVRCSSGSTPTGLTSIFDPEHMPVYIRVPIRDTPMFYGFPAINGPGGGMKIAGEQFEQASSAG